jgi:hypothetical protein
LFDGRVQAISSFSGLKPFEIAQVLSDQPPDAEARWPTPLDDTTTTLEGFRGGLVVPDPQRLACQSQVVRFYSSVWDSGRQKEFVDGTDGGWAFGGCYQRLKALIYQF